MSEQYTFTESVPAKRAGRQGSGRQKEPNPFESAVGAIVGTKGARDASFSLDVENGETLKQRQARIRRFLTRAGKDVAAKQGRSDAYKIALTISQVGDEGSNAYVAKFWDQVAVRES